MHKRQQTCVAKGQIVNNLGSAGHMTFVTAIQLCHCGIKSAKGNVKTNGCGCSNKILAAKAGGGLDLSNGR